MKFNYVFQFRLTEYNSKRRALCIDDGLQAEAQVERIKLLKITRKNFIRSDTEITQRQRTFNLSLWEYTFQEKKRIIN